MKTSARIFALAMTLLLAIGICCPAAHASADSLLSTYKDQIADAIVTIQDDLAAIREEVRAHEEEPGSSSGGVLSELISGVEAALGENPLDNITLGNDFLNGNTIEHNWQVIVDNSHLNNNTLQGTTSSQTSGTPGGTVTTTSPKTGDLNNIVLWIAIVGASALALALTAFLLLRKRNKKGKKK